MLDARSYQLPLIAKIKSNGGAVKSEMRRDKSDLNLAPILTLASLLFCFFMTEANGP